MKIQRESFLASAARMLSPDRGRPTFLTQGNSFKILSSRFFALALVAVVVSTVAPVIADENSAPPATESPGPSESNSPIPADSPSPEATDSPIPSDSTAPAPTGSASDSPAPSPAPAPTDSPTTEATPTASEESPSPSDSPSPTPTPPAPLEDQSMRVNLPNLLLVDPRAYSKNIPSIVLSGPRYMLACLRGANFTFDIYSKNAIDSVFNGVKLVEGDMTSSVILSGTTEQVSALLNSNNGTRLTGIRGPVGGFYAVYNFVAMNMPSLDPEFCSQGSGANTRAIYLRPLGLGMALIKNGVKLRP